jgi:hypothetical protein
MRRNRNLFHSMGANHDIDLDAGTQWGGLAEEPMYKKGELATAIKRIIRDKCVEASTQDLKVLYDNIDFAVEETFRTRRRLREPQQFSEELSRLPPPVPPLDKEQVDEVKKQGGLHPWKDRKESDGRSPVQWVIDYYEKWIPGLLQSHIRLADMPLYTAFAKHVSRNGLPEGLDLPTFAENEMRSAPPHERSTVAIVREWYAAKKRQHRSKQPKLG